MEQEPGHCCHDLLPSPRGAEVAEHHLECDPDGFPWDLSGGQGRATFPLSPSP